MSDVPAGALPYYVTKAMTALEEEGSIPSRESPGTLGQGYRKYGAGDQRYISLESDDWYIFNVETRDLLQRTQLFILKFWTTFLASCVLDDRNLASCPFL